MAKVFFSYAHADEALRNELEKHLASLKHEGLIESWHDRCIVPGQDWAGRIDEHLETSDVILLLTSADFMASSYCFDIETKCAVARHDAGDAMVIPVILRPCDWHNAPFGKLQAVPTDGKPVTTLPNQDAAFVDVVNGIRRAIERMHPQREQIGKVTVAPPGKVEAYQAMPASSPRSSNLRVCKEFSERDRDRFLHDSFEFIARFFQNSLEELKRRNAEIDTDFRRIDANSFEAAVYAHGKRECSCGIWLMNPRSELMTGIAYSSGGVGSRGSGMSYNEMLSVTDEGFTLALKAMGMAHHITQPNDQLSKQGAGEYFWSMLIEPLQR